MTESVSFAVVHVSSGSAMLLRLIRLNPLIHSYGCDGGGYGVFFYDYDSLETLINNVTDVTHLTDGTSTQQRIAPLFVHVSNPLVLKRKGDVYSLIGAVLKRKNVSDAFVKRLCDTHPRSCRHSEMGVCVMATRLGYDSVRMPFLGGTVSVRGAKGVWTSSQAQIVEWVVCRGGAAGSSGGGEGEAARGADVQCDACPPVILNRANCSPRCCDGVRFQPNWKAELREIPWQH